MMRSTLDDYVVRSADMRGAASLLAPLMGWSPSLVESTFGMGHPVLSDVIRDDDKIVGVVHLVSGMPGLPEDLLILRLGVAKTARGKGIGGALWARVLEQLPRAASVASRTPAGDVRSLAIATRWGFTSIGTTLYQRRDLTAESLTVPAAVPNVSLEVVQGRLVGEMRDRVASAMVAGGVLDLSIPTDVDPEGTSGTFETEPTLSIIAAQPGDAIVVFAVADGVDVGYTIAFTEEFGWHVGDSGVVPAWRRRGVATWVKAELAHVAASQGARWLTTHNDEANAPILALNEASGFHVLNRIVSLRRG